ncbi:hypothetical protein V6N13_073158 [Hibiscus sabdariffa]|uniref:RING-type E3 ubiquitin transferase n=1 Tax=Hibiscus sabdariffa TaxID=183260 RepID=A0ABR2E8R4_9ROSI
MFIILEALLCALICALGLNFIMRCALRCGKRFGLDCWKILYMDTFEETTDRLAATRGLEKSALRKIPVAIYSPRVKVKVKDCLICLGEFMDGGKVRVLPKCNHGFHVRCIDTWLMSHSSCLTCMRSLLDQITSSDVAVLTKGKI